MSGVGEVILVVPAYNEAGRLDLPAFAAALDAMPWLALHFVDDGSTDATRTMLAAFADAHRPRVAVQGLAGNVGKAEAVRSGMREAMQAGSAAVGFADADLSAPLGELALLRDALDAHPEAWAAIGSRIRLLGREIHRSPARHYLGRVFATAASLALGLPVYDTQCGLKLFRNIPPVRAALEAPFASRWIFDVELIARLAAAPGEPPATRRIREVPLEHWVATDGSRLRGRDFLAAPMELLAIHRRYRGRR
ncbi:MAG: glycosyltransferase [Gemmatimonadetes bacterium]|nr:glycosyltransferase [Gemmatimonadota bacterium]MCB9504792.1 glycosyltransferase [Gemmatimonadales bacterium]MCB9518814.1 glycosyltransferase [Gemmatimonadales bacterium]